jgi:integrase
MVNEEEYLEFVTNVLGLKQVADYRSLYRKIYSYFGSTIPFTFEHCLRFKQKLVKEEYAPNSINNHIKVIKHLCSYYEMYKIPYDEQIKSLKYEKKTTVSERETLTECEIILIAKQKLQFSSGPFKLNKIQNAKLNLKYKAMIYLLACGARIDEVVTLTWNNVYSDRIKVTGKTGERILSIPNKLYRLMEHLDRYPHNYVLGSRQGKLYDINANKIIREKVKLAGINKYITSHCFRHSYIMNNILAGESIAVIAEQVGHKSWETTRQYSHLTHTHTKKQIEGYKVFRGKKVDDEKESLLEKIMKTNDKNKLRALSLLLE